MATKDFPKKVYLNGDQQIEKLRNDGLSIPNVEHAKRRLKWEGYYNFAVGYNRLFKDESKRYVRGVTFAHIEALFDFDRRLREIVYESTQQVELNLKAILSDVFSARYGVDERVYLQERNFTGEPSEQGNVRSIIGVCRAALNDACKRGSPTYRDYVAYYDSNYKHVPFWVLVRMLSFGNTSRFLSLLKSDDGRTVAKEYGVDFHTLCALVDYVVDFRNIAAHGERVYCAHLNRERLPNGLGLTANLELPKKQDGAPMYGFNDCMGLFIALKYLLPKWAFDGYFDELVRIVDGLEQQLPAFAFERALKEMGLQGNWKKMSKLPV